MSYSAPGSAGRASSSPAGVGVITADPAQLVGPNAPVRHSPTAKGFIDPPTIPLDTYKRIKEGDGAEKQGNAADAQGAEASAPSPLAITNPGGFNGATQGSPAAVPPDINGAVSSDQIASVVTNRLLVWTKSTSPTLISERHFSTVTGQTASFFAPRILFDRQWKRWVISIDSQPENATLQTHYLLFSRTSNAAGSYYVYSPNAAAAEWCGTGGSWGYPQIGMTQDAVIVTGNCFNGNPLRFTGAKTFAVAKAVVYNGGGFSVPKFSLPASDGVTTPPVVKDANPRAYLLTRSVHKVTFANPQAAFYGSITGNVPIGGFFTPSVPRDAGQTGCSATSCRLDTGDGRFVAPSTQYGDHLWNVATYGRTGNGTRATPSWGDFDTEGAGANTTKQRGQVSFDSCSDDFNASLAAGVDGRVWLNWSSTDPQGSPCGQSRARMMLAGRLASTPANTMSNQLLAFTSCCTLTGNFDPAYGTQRWGGTSSVSVDPTASNTSDTAWAWNQTVASSSLWGTRAQQVNNP